MSKVKSMTSVNITTQNTVTVKKEKGGNGN
ncbi:MAG: hypothetical protein CM15mV71_380 [Caudoviricetes sp.]|nr:MAG: hypothetical protein CM15mV71_380 [Caudoviricetes sp.]